MRNHNGENALKQSLEAPPNDPQGACGSESPGAQSTQISPFISITILRESSRTAPEGDTS